MKHAWSRFGPPANRRLGPQRPEAALGNAKLATCVSWLLGFLLEDHGPLIRERKLPAYTSSSMDVVNTSDAPPWGLGGVIFVNGEPKEFFKSPITVHDERRFRFKIGDRKGLPICEALSVLVALRVWRKY